MSNVVIHTIFEGSIWLNPLTLPVCIISKRRPRDVGGFTKNDPVFSDLDTRLLKNFDKTWLLYSHVIVYSSTSYITLRHTILAVIQSARTKIKPIVY